MRLLLLCLVLLTNLFALAGQEIFLSTLDGRLYSLDLNDCSYTGVGQMPVSSTDISFHPNGNLYAITGNGRLFEINVMTGGSTLIYTFEQSASQLYTALTISAEGIFYASGLDGDLWRYDFDSDNGVFLGNIGFGAEGDLTFFNGQLYMASQDDNIVLVDIEDPSNSSIAINGNVPGRIFGIVSYAASCDSISVYALTNNAAQIFEVDFENNVLLPYCNIPLQVSGGASTFEFLGSNPVFIDEVNAGGFDCLEATGSISITARGGVGALTYSINGVDFQTSPDFTDLPLADYIIYVADEVGCVRTQLYAPENPGPQVRVIDFTPPSCGNDDGSIQVEITGSQPPIAFTLNGEAVNPATLNNLAAGTYVLGVMDANFCESTETFVLNTTDPLLIDEVNVQSTSCGQTNGIVSVTVASGVAPFTFSLNGGAVQNENFFLDLGPGSYTIEITDQAGCTIMAQAMILPSNSLAIDTLFTNGATCGEANGQLEVVAVGGNGPLSYELNGGGFTGSSSFSGLPGGSYVAVVQDNQGCMAMAMTNITTTPSLAIELSSQRPAACLQENGEVSLAFSGGLGSYFLVENGRSIPLAEQVVGLGVGNYRYVLTDSIGCTDSLTVEISSGRCPVYLPTAFSPDFDGLNDFFGPLAAESATARIINFQVFDRWGGLVFDRANGELTDPTYRWDGTRLGENAPTGVYVYWLELEYPDGEREVFSGDVLLIRGR